MATLRILLLEDSLLDTELIQSHLAEGGIDCALVRVETRPDFVSAVEDEDFDLILSDYSLPAFDGISALAIAQATCPDVPFIFVSATLGEELAVEALKSGATDYVLKQRLWRLVPSLKRALREAKVRGDRQQAESALRQMASELEIRVAERTTALAEANKFLKEQILERERVEESLRKSESTLRSYFELPLIGIAITSPNQDWIEVNDKLCEILGYERQELVSMTWTELTHPEDLDADLAEFNKLLMGQSEGYSLDKRFIRKDTQVIHAYISVRCVRDPDGSVDYFVALVQDITERKRAEEERAQLIREQAARLEAEEQGRKVAFLAEASTVLASSLDYETTLVTVAQLAVPFIADWCAVDILDDATQAISRVAIAHRERAKVELAWALNRRYPEQLNVAAGLPRLWQTGQSVIATEITAATLSAIAQDAEHLQVLQTLGLKSYVTIPLVARGRTLGAITLMSAESGRRYQAADLPLLEDLARRAALAVDNARLYRETQQARQFAEQTAERNASLQALTAALGEAMTPAQVGEIIVNQGLSALKASAGFIALLSDNDESLEVIRALGYPQELLGDGDRLPMTSALPIVDAVQTKKPILCESRAVWAERYPHYATQYGSRDCQAKADIPLIVEGRTVGGISFGFLEARTFSEDDRAFMLALAQQSAQAIERTRAYAAERQARAESEAARRTAEAANRTKDEFLATLSHELRTPLNAMLGWTQLLQTRKLDEEKMVRALETINRNTRSLATLIDDILDVSRIMSGKLHLAVHTCDLVSVIEAAIESVRPAAEAKSIQLRLFLNASTGPVWGDVNRLQQVVWNLLSNAIKFTPKDGQVEVRLERHLSDADGNYAQIRVSDTGKGISPDFLPHVFERFLQENSTSTRSHGGLGLGLAIVRYLVELHGGTVQAASQGEGLGSTFTVHLPIRDRAEPSLPLAVPLESALVPSAHPQTLAGLRVLIVDDEADARELLTTILEQCGAQVTATASASEAVDFLLHARVEILVSDIAMPNVDGYMLIRQVRQLESQRGYYTPAIALTAYARELDRDLALEAGFQVHIAKPFDPALLIKAIAELASQEHKRLRMSQAKPS